MAQSVGIEEAKDLMSHLCLFSELRCVLTRFQMCDLAVD